MRYVLQNLIKTVRTNQYVIHTSGKKRVAKQAKKIQEYRI